MTYLLVTVTTALAFWSFSSAVYGYDGVLETPWIDCVVCWLLTMGVMLGWMDDTESDRTRRLCLRHG
jgi:hypothetical protein